MNRGNYVPPRGQLYFFIFMDLYMSFEEIVKKTKDYIDTKLMPVIKKHGNWLCGNLFTEHSHTTYADKYIDKQRNIVYILNTLNAISVATTAAIPIMEIGFNSGFSALLMLFSNENIHLTCVDIAEHPYALECMKIMKSDFPDRIEFHIGDSREILPKLIQNNKHYDLIHIDGNHLTDIAEIDIINSYCLSNEGGIIIMDDYDCRQHPHNIHGFWDGYSAKYNLQEFVVPHPTCYHSVKRVIGKNQTHLEKEKDFHYYFAREKNTNST